MQKRKKAFTLTEILVVIVVLASLSAVAIPQYKKMIEARKTGEAEAVLTAVRTEQERRCAVGKTYATLDQLSEFVPKTETQNFTYSQSTNGQGLIASSKGDYSYSLKILTYRDGRICCDGDDCGKFNYPKCTEIQGSLVSAPECGGTDEIPEGYHDDPPPSYPPSDPPPSNPCDEERSCPSKFPNGSPTCSEEDGWNFSTCFSFEQDCSSCTNTALLVKLDFDTDDVYNSDGNICYRYKKYADGRSEDYSVTSQTCSQCPTCDEATGGAYPYGSPECHVGKVYKDKCYKTERHTYDCHEIIGKCVGGWFGADTKIYYGKADPEPPDFSKPFNISGCYALTWQSPRHSYSSCNDGKTQKDCGDYLTCAQEGDICVYKSKDGQCFESTCGGGRDHVDWGDPKGACSMADRKKIAEWGIDVDDYYH